MTRRPAALEVVHAGSVPYGFTVTCWAGSALLAAGHGRPREAAIVLFAAGALLGFALIDRILAGVAAGWLMPLEWSTARALPLGPVGGAIGAIWLASTWLSGDACWGVGGLLATSVYFGGLVVELHALDSLAGGRILSNIRTDVPKCLHEERSMSDPTRLPVPTGELIRTSTETAGILTSDEYFKVVQKPNTRPALWKYADVMAVLNKLGEDPLREAERRFCTTINNDCGDLVGAVPFIFLGWQLIHPGEHVPPHRHNSFAIYHILQGSGYTIVEGDTYYWEKGDTLACPAWAYHEHIAEGDEDTLMYVVQDMPMLAASRTLFWEEPIGSENIRQMVTGTSPSWSATRTDVPN